METVTRVDPVKERILKENLDHRTEKELERIKRAVDSRRNIVLGMERTQDTENFPSLGFIAPFLAYMLFQSVDILTGLLGIIVSVLVFWIIIAGRKWRIGRIKKLNEEIKLLEKIYAKGISINKNSYDQRINWIEILESEIEKLDSKQTEVTFPKLKERIHKWIMGLLFVALSNLTLNNVVNWTNWIKFEDMVAAVIDYSPFFMYLPEWAQWLIA